MPLSLGLSRITRLLKVLGNPDTDNQFRTLHVAGTNGKGSICSYLSHILTANNVANGRFTSPHLLKRSDSIQIDNVPVDENLFETYEKDVAAVDKQYGIGCTEFELLTCVAFKLFKDLKVDVGIFEVGVGGKEDATNVLSADKLISTGISKIGMDHQKLLGNTIEEIATQKLGIMKPGVPCVIDGSNSQTVLALAEETAKNMGSDLYKETAASKYTFGSLQEFKPSLLGKYQLCNLSVALRMVDLVKKEGFNITKQATQDGVSHTKWPGRLQILDLQTDQGTLPILLDGAHNPQAVHELVDYLDGSYRKGNLIYVMAIKRDKNLEPIFKLLFKPGDTVIFTQFKEGVDGMPWVHPSSATELACEAQGKADDIRVEPVLEDALEEAYRDHEKTGRDVVVCGSLYLVSDILRLDDAHR